MDNTLFKASTKVPVVNFGDTLVHETIDIKKILSDSSNVIIDLRHDAEFCKWRFKNNVRLEWETARQGKLYCVLPARGTELIVAGSDYSVLEHCYSTLSESGYRFPYGIWMLPESYASMPGLEQHIECNVLSESEAACVNRVLWKPSPVILKSFPLILKAIKGDGVVNIDMRMLDVGAGSGRDAVWPVTHSSPLFSHLSTVVALDSTPAMLQRAEALSSMNGVPSAWFALDSDSRVTSADQMEQSVIRSDGSSKKVILFHADATVPGIFNRALHASLSLHPPFPSMNSPSIAASPIKAAKLLSITGFDIIHIARYLNRSLFPALRKATLIGGFVLYHHFLEGSFRPKDKSQLLKRDELKHAFGPDHGFEVVLGRECSLFVAL